jgi:hypothetical protein
MEQEKTSSKPLVVHTCEVQGKFPDLNDILDAAKSHYQVYRKMKRDAQIQASWFMHRLPEIKRPVKIYFIWNEADRRRDPDNITAAQKFLLDELVRLKKIPNDTSKWVKGIYHDFTFGGDYKVTIYLEEQ